MTCAPGRALASLAAVFCFAAATAFSEFAWLLLPLAAVHIGTATDTAACVVLAAGVAHNDARPILNRAGVQAVREILYYGEDVAVVCGQEKIPDMGVFRQVSQELEGHEDVLLPVVYVINAGGCT